ncbi:hypothetical protein [Ruegeria arenilitoris]|uniref:hypothetical protein n=1 Tax=Ruegeria arenilitoris TaxID=1173585 RepID=UPI00147C8A0E|nr:hypothetical protein [Ruegeria arenilitoris]
MTFTDKEICRNFWGALFASPETRRTRRKRKKLARKKQRETDAQVAKDLRETGHYTDYMQDPFFYRHYYF